MKINPSFLDLPFSEPDLAPAFQQLHEGYKEQLSFWTLAASRRKLIRPFWTRAIYHYCALLALALLPVSVLGQRIGFDTIFGEIIPAAGLVLLSLCLTLYGRYYYNNFLPRLDNCVAAYHNDHLQGIQQCKKEQFSVLTLMMIEYAERKMAGLPDLLINKETVQPLSKKYGVSVKSIENSLQIIILAQWNRKSLRKRTEIQDDFETAEAYFMDLKFGKALCELNLLYKKVGRIP